MNSAIVSNILDDEPFISERMCGLTNFVYKVVSRNKIVIHRQYTTIFSIFQDREREVKLQCELAKLQLAPKVLYSDTLQRVEEFLPYNSVSLSEIKQDYVQVARMLGQFHKLKDRFTNIFQQPSIKQWLHHPGLREKIYSQIPENNQKLQNAFEYIFSDKVQSFILGLFEDPSLEALPLVIAHNDLNATNFLKDVRKMQYHLIDFEFAGLNYIGYELANFFNEMEWDYTYPEPPYFKIRDGWDSELKLNFIKEYWRVFADSQEIPDVLFRQIEIGGILQNYFWLLIGFLSLQRDDQGIDLELYILKRAMNINKLNL